jgi:hypothetical protein
MEEKEEGMENSSTVGDKGKEENWREKHFNVKKGRKQGREKL